MFAELSNSADDSYPPPFRRTVVIRSATGHSEASVIDNVHEFVVRVLHDGERVVDVIANAVRFPWTTCPLGIGRLKSLSGSLLSDRVSRAVDQSDNCTHMLDLAKLAIAHAVDVGEINYAISIDALRAPSECVAVIKRNGCELFRWHVVGNTIKSPTAFQAHVTEGRARWSDAVQSDLALREAAFILRRSLLVFAGRRVATPRIASAAALGYTPSACLSFQPAFLPHAVRPAGYIDLMDLKNNVNQPNGEFH